MCVLVLANDINPQYNLVVAVNRDEFYNRPTAPAGWWEDHPDVLAGRDLAGGGTWMGVTSQGRFAALTNYRQPGRRVPSAPSRGKLVSEFLVSKLGAREYLDSVRLLAGRYNGFSLILRDATGLYWYSNRGGDDPVSLGPGVFGQSNHLLDTPWPKVERGKRGLRAALEASGDTLIERLLALLGEGSIAGDEELPDTGVGLELERFLSSIFIASPVYGTCSSSVILFDRGGEVTFVEQRFLRGEKQGAPARFSFHTGRNARATP